MFSLEYTGIYKPDPLLSPSKFYNNLCKFYCITYPDTIHIAVSPEQQVFFFLTKTQSTLFQSHFCSFTHHDSISAKQSLFLKQCYFYAKNLSIVFLLYPKQNGNCLLWLNNLNRTFLLYNSEIILILPLLLHPCYTKLNFFCLLNKENWSQLSDISLDFHA